MYSCRNKSHRSNHKSVHSPPTEVIVNPQDDPHPIVHSSPYNDPHIIATPMSMHRTPLMASSRSITSACTGRSYIGNETPRSVRYIPSRKTSTTGIFSDSETSRTRSRPSASPYLHSNYSRHQQTYATMKIKRHEPTIRYQPSRKIYDDIDNLSTTNGNFREFIQVLDSLAQEKFGVIEFAKDTLMASSPTDTNESLTLDSGYQSTKQLINHDEYAVIMKTKVPSSSEQQKYLSQRRRSYSSIDNQTSFCT